MAAHAPSANLHIVVDNGEIDNENCQGPHNWRKGLRPVAMSSPIRETAPTDTETAEGSGSGSRLNPSKTDASDLLTEAYADVDSKQEAFDRTLMDKRLCKDERFDGTRIRERLKAMPAVRKDTTENKAKARPMVAKRSASKRFTVGNSSESAFTRQVVKPTSPRVPRRKQLSPANPARLPLTTEKKTGAVCGAATLCPPTSTRRPPSPNLEPAVHGGASSEASRRRVERVRKARLYLLQQMGPNSFLIGGDSPDNKYRVIIGPQRCSCGKGPHCVHVLFIMLRVFQVRETDPCLWSKSLKNYEVESLFRNFHARRTLRLRDLAKKTQPVMSSPTDQTDTVSMCDGDLHSKSVSEDQTVKDDESTCPICLLEMVEGESLTKCDVGCQNEYHHHCVAIWFQECQRQEEPLICPLCRSPWKSESGIYRAHSREELEAPPNTRASSPLHVTANDVDVLLHNAAPIPAELQSIAHPWIPVLGEEHTSCFFSKNWVVRELALKHLAHIAKGSSGVSEDYMGLAISPDTGHSTLEVTCSVLAHMCADPVYKVFVGGLRTLRTALSYTRCEDKEEEERLQQLLRPVISTILWKCADSNKRTSQLSLSALQEFVKGQLGELAVGKELTNAGMYSVGGLPFVVACIVSEPADVATCQWQWYLGRLYALERLIDEHTSDFEVPVGSSGRTYDQVMAVLTFVKHLLEHTHAKVSRVARRMFYRVARMQTRKDVLRDAVDMLADVGKHVQVYMKRKLLRVASVVSGDGSCDASGDMSGDVSGDLSADVSGDDISVTHASQRHLQLPLTGIDRLALCTPIVPPNSPSKRGKSVKRSQRSQRKTRSRKTRDGASVIHVDTQKDSETNNVTIPDRLSENDRELAKPDDDDEVSQVSTEHTDTASQAARPSGDSPFLFAYENAYADVADGPPTTRDTNRPAVGTSSADELDGASSSSLQANASDSPPARLSADLSDITLSPPTPHNGDVVSFKTEIASSPQHTTARQTTSHGSSEPCLCKEEMEKEEAQALVEAMQKSVIQQDTLPYVPGLSRLPSESTLTIHVQNQPSGNQTDGSSTQPHHYLEGTDWLRGPTIGTGAFSTCYQARDVKTGTLMAVKQIAFCRNSLSEQELVVDAVREEIEMMAKINHPNIVRILGATQQACHFFMFVEWMPGGSVAGLLDMYGAFNDHVITNYTQQMIRGLAHLHENQILHRDLKGANLLVDGTGQRLRIGDFGASARLASRLTGAGEFQGQLLGTIAFMAPEVLRGESYGRSCDVWSIGCTMVEMATTKPPWGASDISNHLALIFKIASTNCPPPIPEFLSPAVRDLMLRCLECNRDDRPSASELLKHPLFTSCR